jgi:hypothetical protein
MALSAVAALSVFVAIAFLGAPGWIIVPAMYGTATILWFVFPPQSE